MSRIINHDQKPDKLRAAAVIYLLCAVVLSLCSILNFMKKYPQFGFVYAGLCALFAVLALVNFIKYKKGS